MTFFILLLLLQLLVLCAAMDAGTSSLAVVSSNLNVISLTVAQNLENSLVRSVTSDLVNEMTALIEKISFDDNFKTLVGSFVSEVEYQGFDVMMILKAAAWIFMNTYSRNKDAFIADLVFLVVTFVNRGVINQRNLNRMKTTGAQKYNEIAGKFRIQQSRGGLAPHIITLPRLCQAFPVLTCQISQMIGGKDFAGPFQSHTFPAFMKNSAFAAVIPTTSDVVKEILQLLYACYSTDQSVNLMNPKPGQSKYLEIFQKQLTFIKLATNGSLVSQHDRVKFLKLHDAARLLAKCGPYLKRVAEQLHTPEPVLLTQNQFKKVFGSKENLPKIDNKDNELLRAFGLVDETKPDEGDDDHTAT